eukprot:TRINITY_DN6104_c0_g1_i3.p1 TRINITY_DN6104_c0_g1~~TRINITY_DN6104_c0_g1_i3.p1  ORF type:complete len:174 (-),score=39.50 TRINITY_DN6104_c0_g1_i3:93-614(-)
MALDKLYLREITATEWEDVAENEERLPELRRRQHQNEHLALQLPNVARFVAIAAYLASHNPPKTDIRYFASTPSQTRGGNALGVRGAMQLRSFPLERLLAIFFSISATQLVPPPATNEVHMQIATLISLNILGQTSSRHNLDAPRLRSNLAYERVLSLAESVSLDLATYLHRS